MCEYIAAIHSKAGKTLLIILTHVLFCQKKNMGNFSNGHIDYQLKESILGKIFRYYITGRSAC
jgi:hypothetical protein